MILTNIMAQPGLAHNKQTVHGTCILCIAHGSGKHGACFLKPGFMVSSQICKLQSSCAVSRAKLLLAQATADFASFAISIHATYLDQNGHFTKLADTGNAPSFH